MRRWIVPVLTMVLLMPTALPAAGKYDAAREHRLAAEIEPLILQGSGEWLKSKGGVKFFAIYTPPSGPVVHGGVILLHGMGANPDWSDVIRPLRTGLADRGWATLSLQMPLLASDATAKDYVPLFPDVPPRIEAGIAFLRARHIAPIMLVGYSLGAAMGAWFLAHTPHSGIRAFVGIGMSGNPDPKSPLDTAASLGSIHIPVLDLYGSQDFRSVLSALPARAAAARAAGNHAYRQVGIDGAGHSFSDLDGPLIRKVSTWLWQYGHHAATNQSQ